MTPRQRIRTVLSSGVPDRVPFHDSYWGNTTVWSGIPSIALLDDTMDKEAFEVYLEELFGEVGTGQSLILGVSGNVPPDANLSRLERIKERIEAFGPVKPQARY